ncbi:sterol carrier family protein [Nesterenkonia ebinurensis]|uniref:sterol carrier family protein n=1 Tax=Nesterenkonia ebinurensis TaxID=2608252 RepID=UPI00123E0B1C|nr:sterol carrier family protein [Nesterenkonia ebinurensis]
MARRRISEQQGQTALQTWAEEHDGADSPDRRTLATAVRYLLEELAERAPGNSVEVRVPPYGVTQCIAGPAHTRGTPPNIVELDPATWLQLATGRLRWEQAQQTGRITASGTRADLSHLLPLSARLSREQT